MNTTTKPQRIRVLCVDDHAFLVDGLKIRLQVETDMEFVGRLETADDLIPGHPPQRLSAGPVPRQRLCLRSLGIPQQGRLP
ncbi:MAG: hypothetical protein ACYTAQ_11485 [Planctomycetota bacterium]|jgi:hypothetical protein